MNKILLEIVLCIIFAIFYGLLARYLNADTIIITLLILIYVKILIKGSE